MQEKRIKSSDSLHLSNVDQQDNMPSRVIVVENSSKDQSMQLDKVNHERSESKATTDQPNG